MLCVCVCVCFTVQKQRRRDKHALFAGSATRARGSSYASSSDNSRRTVRQTRAILRYHFATEQTRFYIVVFYITTRFALRWLSFDFSIDKENEISAFFRAKNNPTTKGIHDSRVGWFFFDKFSRGILARARARRVAKTCGHVGCRAR